MCHVRNLTIVKFTYIKMLLLLKFHSCLQSGGYQSLGSCFIVCNAHKTRNGQSGPPFSLCLLPCENNEMDAIQAHSAGTRNIIPCMKHNISKKESNHLKLHVLNTHKVKSELQQQMKSRKCCKWCLS